ncbi:hypothetical protein JOQ06_016972 [Pogonophryne albipinna]|uniref:DUF4371 domain-containing protein n=1 Tax=Pogonophryne albipinna TaxID=1090488 RepID=A0AAD6B1E4_9TELE|nr:hypothetical protein JOQ06_016972 [Pogonophryne albipinna]
MATSKTCDAKSLTELVLSKLRDIGLCIDKVLSQCYDGANVMSGVHGGMQKILQEVLDVCNSLYKFFRKPTVAAVYTGEKLKRLLDQRWTGHLVTVNMKSLEHIVHLLREIEDNQTSAAAVRIESTGILKAITQTSFQFIACMMYQILSLLDPPNTALQAKSTDLYTGVRLVQSALVCVEELRCDSQFDTLWEKFTKDRETIEPLAAAPPKKRGRVMSHLRDYVVDTTVGHRPEGLGEKTV